MSGTLRHVLRVAAECLPPDCTRFAVHQRGGAIILDVALPDARALYLEHCHSLVIDEKQIESAQADIVTARITEAIRMLRSGARA